MSNQSLFGTQSTKGHIDVMLALLELKDKLLYESITSLGLSAQVVHALQSNFNSVSAHRKKVAPIAWPMETCWTEGGSEGGSGGCAPGPSSELDFVALRLPRRVPCAEK